MAKVSKDLQKAIENLSISDVYQRNSRAYCADDFDAKSFSNIDDLHVEQMHSVHSSEVLNIDNSRKILRVLIRLGTRWALNVEQDEIRVKATIESDFIAEYLIKAPLAQSCINEFSLNNASFHVWPYWREYLSSQCERMRLPRVILPAVQFNK